MIEQNSGMLGRAILFVLPIIFFLPNCANGGQDNDDDEEHYGYSHYGGYGKRGRYGNRHDNDHYSAGKRQRMIESVASIYPDYAKREIINAIEESDASEAELRTLLQPFQNAIRASEIRYHHVEMYEKNDVCFSVKLILFSKCDRNILFLVFR